MQLSKTCPLVASASKGGLTLAVGQVAVTIFVKLTLRVLSRMAYPLLPPRTLLDTSGNKFSSSRNGLENIFESPATKLV
jgi:hypothetical protein